jgi:hypothetical protein
MPFMPAPISAIQLAGSIGIDEATAAALRR